MAVARSHDAVTSALVPVCVDQARRDPGRVDKLATIEAAKIYQRGDAVMAAGWATLPGMVDPDPDLAKACVEGLALDAT